MAMYGNLNSSNNQTDPASPYNLLDEQIVFLFITLIATVLGNSLVLAAICLDSRLRSVTNCFVACLAVSDLLVACFSVSIRLVTYFFLRRQESLHEVMNVHICRFWNWIDIFCEAASIYTLTVISIDRYYKISRPFQYREKMTKARATCIIVFIWIFAALLATLVLIPFGNAKGIKLEETSCSNDNKIFYTMASVVAFFFPFAVLIVMYTLIFRIALYHFKKDHAMTSTDPVTGKPQQYSAYKDLKATRTVFVVVATFFVCWGPFFTLFLIEQHQPRLLITRLGVKTHTVLVVIFFILLPSANSSFNPIIYACFDKVYRRSFYKIILKMIGRSEYLGKTKRHNREQGRRHASVFESPPTQPNESTASCMTRLPPQNTDEESSDDDNKGHDNEETSSPSGALASSDSKETDVMLKYER